MVEQVGEQSEVGRHGPDFGLAECVAKGVERIIARGAVGDRLGNHAVIGRRDFVALVHCAVEAEADAVVIVVGFVGEGGEIEALEAAGGWEEAACRVLGAEARFDGVAGERDLRLGRELFAAGDPKLKFNEVEAGDQFGDGVLDLEACVHFHEPEAVGTQRA